MADLLARRGPVSGYVLTLQAEHQPAGEALKGLDGVLDVVKLEGRPSYRITFNPDQVDTNAIVAAVMESGGRLASFSEDARQLSHAFMELTEPGVPS